MMCDNQYQKDPRNSLEAKASEIIAPLQRFANDQITSSILLFVCAFSAIIIANSHANETLGHFFHTSIGLVFGNWQFVKDIHFWINDGLMALFFFLLGLEIKQSFLVGDLQNKKFALLVVCAAIGGAFVPALIYISFNQAGVGATGWGIPIATDTAFALGALALFRNKIPAALFTFLTALAIVDDIFAVSIIGLFYSNDIVLVSLLSGLLLAMLLIVLNVVGVRAPLPYLVIGLFLWFYIYKSGIHSTIAGILVALIIPARPKVSPKRFLRKTEKLMVKFEEQVVGTDNSILADEKQHELVEKVEESAKLATTPLQRWRDSFDLPVGLFVLPIFALANAGVNFTLINFDNITTNWIIVGITLGLVLGKVLGISVFTWLSVKCKVGVLPPNLRLSDVVGVSLLCGIGFTMSIYIANLAFHQNPEMLDASKFGILLGSLISGAAGISWFYLSSKKRSHNVQEPARDIHT